MKQKIKNYYFKIIILIITVFCFSFNFPSNTNAAQLISTSDVMTAFKFSELSNHTIEFTTPSGVAAGQSITIVFAPGFSIGSVDDTDIDLEDDTTNLMLGPAAVGATWGASFAGNTLTIISGTGVILGGSVIKIEIGLNATFQVLGDAQITNPATVGSHNINIAGTFGDFNSMAVSIVDSNVVGISARVEEGGGPPGGDTTPPVCSNILVTNITRESARITWVTNEAANSYVDYGKTLTYELGTIFDGGYVLIHNIDLTGLSASTEYFVNIRSRDAFGNERTCGQASFETLGQPLLFIRAIPEKRLPSSGNNSTILRVIVYDIATENIMLDGSVTTDKDGFDRTLFFPDYTNLPKSYNFLIKGYSHLKKRINNVPLTANLDLADLSFGVTVFLLAGDTNGISGDNYINSLDFSVISNNIYTSDYKTDLNQDKYVNGLDYAIAATNILKFGDE